MTYRLQIQPRARAGAMMGFHWYFQKSPEAAERWMVGLSKTITSLIKNPEIHPIAETESEQSGFAIRESLFGRRPHVYRVLFTIDADMVNVIAVRHSA